MSKHKILLLDDDKEIHLIFKKFLEGTKFSLESAHTLDEALLKIEKESFSFIFIDVILENDQVSAEIFNSIKSISKNYLTPVVIIGRHINEEFSNHVFGKNENIVLTLKKPIAKNDFLNVLNSYQNRKIFILDDDESIALLFSYKLKKVGVQSFHCSECDDATVLLLSKKHSFFSGFIDILLENGSSGHFIQKKIIKFPFFIMSTHATKVSLEELENKNPLFNGKIEKPLNIENIFSLLKVNYLDAIKERSLNLNFEEDHVFRYKKSENLNELSTLVKGSNDEDEVNTLVKGKREDLTEKLQRVTGKIKENTNVLKVKRNNEKKSSDVLKLKLKKQVEELGSKADVNIEKRDGFGDSLIMQAARYGLTDSYLKLIDLGANIYLNNKNSQTILHLAVISGELNIIEDLLKRSLSVNAKDTNHNTPIHFALLRDHIDALEMLLKKDPNLSVRRNGESYLNTALKFGAEKCFTRLLEVGVSISIKNYEGQTVIDLAKSSKKYKRFQIILANYLEKLSA